MERQEQSEKTRRRRSLLQTRYVKGGDLSGGEFKGSDFRDNYFLNASNFSHALRNAA